MSFLNSWRTGSAAEPHLPLGPLTRTTCTSTLSYTDEGYHQLLFLALGAKSDRIHLTVSAALQNLEWRIFAACKVSPKGDRMELLVVCCEVAQNRSMRNVATKTSPTTP